MAAYTCKKCGGTLSAPMKFCGSCGAAVEDAHTPSDTAALSVTPDPDKPVKPKPAKPKRRMIAVLAMSVVVVLAAAGAAAFLLWPPDVKSKGSITVLTLNDETVVIPHGGKRPVTLSGTLAGQATSLDGTRAALLINENGQGVAENGYVLYWVTDKPHRVAEGVYEMLLSASGEGIAFTRNENFNTHTADLCLYSGGKLTILATDFNRGKGMCISPDGKTVAYATQNGDSAFYWDGKQAHALGHEITPVAIANKGKYVYYHHNNTFYAQRGSNSDTRTRLGDLTHPQLAMHFNKNNAQILYMPDGRTYISRLARQRAQLPGEIETMLLSHGVLAPYDFSNTFYLNTAGEVIRLDRRWKANPVAEEVSHAHVAANGKTLTYLKNKSVYRSSSQEMDTNPVHVTGGNVEAFAATANGDGIYFVNSQGELYYQKGTQSPVLITDDWRHDLSTGYEIPGLFKGKQLVYISGFDLHIASAGKSTQVRGLEGDVVSFGADAHCIWVQTVIRQSGGTVSHYYYSTNGTRFTLVGTVEMK